MILWFAYQVRADGCRCVGEVWADDASQAYAIALGCLHCRVDYVSRQGG